MIRKNIFIINSYIWGILRKYMFFLHLDFPLNSTSIIHIDKSIRYVTKEVLMYMKYDIVDNEVKWLKKLRNLDFTPDFISVEKNIIKMSYAGENLNSTNIPENWQDQIHDIINNLNKEKCSHNDIKPSDLLVLDGKIMLIDFQWATYKDQKYPTNWPKFIGRKYKENMNFNDAKSLKKSIDYIINLKPS